MRGRRGKAFCSLRVGKKPVDTQPPVIMPVPNDAGWHRGPLDVVFFVFDDLSGVALVVSRVDGGNFVRGRATRITGEGPHLLEYAARDAAGNQTRLAAVTLRVDQNAPTRPVVSAPTGSTTDPTPEIRWSASSDSASGVGGYVVLARNVGRRDRVVSERGIGRDGGYGRPVARARRLHGRGDRLRPRRAAALHGDGDQRLLGAGADTGHTGRG